MAVTTPLLSRITFKKGFKAGATPVKRMPAIPRNRCQSTLTIVVSVLEFCIAAREDETAHELDQDWIKTLSPA